MSLRVDYRDAPLGQRADDVPLTDRQAAVYSAMCISSMVCAVGPITSTTLDQYMARLDLYQKLHGGLMYGAKEDGTFENVAVTREDVEQFVPFIVNVSPIPKTAFLKNVIDGYREL